MIIFRRMTHGTTIHRADVCAAADKKVKLNQLQLYQIKHLNGKMHPKNAGNVSV